MNTLFFIKVMPSFSSLVFILTYPLLHSALIDICFNEAFLKFLQSEQISKAFFDLETLTRLENSRRTDDHQFKQSLDTGFYLYRGRISEIYRESSNMFFNWHIIGGSSYLNNFFDEHIYPDNVYSSKCEASAVAVKLSSTVKYCPCIECGENLQKVIPKQEMKGRFSFLFSRNPVSRFISGYTETEFLISKYPFKNKLGSIARFKEFIRLLLSYQGSAKILKGR